MRPLFIVLVILLQLVGCQSTGSVADQARTTAAIHQVVESFRVALVTKNKPLYMSLFFSEKPEEIGWQHVSEDTRLVSIRKTKPDAIKARRIPSNTFVSLIDEAISTKEAREERFSNVQIQTDGEIASVSFDYEFFEGANRTNWGKEMWQLVRTEGGWKIFSVIYTVRDQQSAGGA
jgi:hypothetical protein